VKNACEKAIDFRKTKVYRDYHMYKKWFGRNCPHQQKERG